jgi:hypothetical protein
VSFGVSIDKSVARCELLTIAAAVEAGEFSLLEKPDTPSRVKRKGGVFTFTHEVSKVSTGTCLAPTGTVSDHVSDAIHSEWEGEGRSQKRDDRDCNILIDLDTPPSAKEMNVNVIDVQLIDVTGPATECNTLIGPGQPEERALADDFAALVDIFSGYTTLFEDEGFNVSP